MRRWIAGGIFIAVMIGVWFLARAIVDNFGIVGTAVWLLGCVAIAYWMEPREAINER